MSTPPGRRGDTTGGWGSASAYGGVSAGVLGGDRSSASLGGGPKPTPKSMPKASVSKMKEPSAVELARAAAKNDLLKNWFTGKVTYRGPASSITLEEDLREFTRIRDELLSYALVYFPSWAVPYVTAMINGIHSVEVLSDRIMNFFDYLRISPPQDFMDVLKRFVKVVKPIEVPFPMTNNVVERGTGGSSDVGTSFTYRSLGRGRPLVGVV